LLRIWDDFSISIRELNGMYHALIFFPFAPSITSLARNVMARRCRACIRQDVHALQSPVFRCRLSISGILTCAVVAVGTGSSSGAGAGVGLGAAAGAELVWLVVLLELFVWLDLLHPVFLTISPSIWLEQGSKLALLACCSCFVCSTTCA